jgi:hypothetical protein
MDMNVTGASRSAGASQGTQSSSGGGGASGQIAQLQQRKATIQGQIAQKEAYAKECYNAQAGPGQLNSSGGSSGGLDKAKVETGKIMANWAMGPGAGAGEQGVDQLKAELASIDEQIASLESQQQAEQQQQNDGSSNSENQSKVKELEDQVSSLRTEESQALKRNDLPKAQEIDIKIDTLQSRINAMRGGNKVPAAAQ